jgi:glycolate oxidase FAD binding subunit
LDWGCPPERVDLVLSTLGLNRVVEHAAGDMTVTVEAGCTVAALQQHVAQRNQRLALDPLWPDRATVGGVLATNDGGSLSHAFGGLRDLILGVTVALPDGTLARSGGKVVKNVAGYDLPKLMVGAFGTLGVVTSATFRLHPLPEKARTLYFHLEPTCDLWTFADAMNRCRQLVSGVQITGWAAHVRVEGPEAAIDTKVEQVIQAAAAVGADEDEPGDHPWSAGQRLFEIGRAGVVCKVSLPPTQLPVLEELAHQSNPESSYVIQPLGTGFVRFVATVPDTLVPVVQRARARLAQCGGSLVVLQCPPHLKPTLDAWGDVGSALPLMRLVKKQFDPHDVLNPGRFVGGI